MPNQLTERVINRKHGRLMADTVLGIIEEEVKQMQPLAVEAFYETINAKLFPKQPDDKTVKAMSDSQAIAFGKTEMKFGLHKGKTIDEIPLEYLLWLTEEQNGLIQQLRSYLASGRIQREQEEPK